MAVKRLRKEESVTERVVDRLSRLPESVQLHILSFLDARLAVKTSVLSKSWVSVWTCVPVLNFNSDGFKECREFDNFVINALSRRQPVKLDRLSFKYGGTCSAKILKKVLRYSFLHGVEELEANVIPTMGDYKNWRWPISSSNSLTSLKLMSIIYVCCPFLEQRSVRAFRNLTSLHLEWVIITDLNPFPGFPALQKLRLTLCNVKTNGSILNVHALQLSEFTSFNMEVGHCEFKTPKLRYFELAGNDIPCLKGHFPVLGTAIINYTGCYTEEQQKINYCNLLKLFHTLHGAKSLTVSAHTVRLLSLFPLDGCSPFWDLKRLKFDFSSRHMYGDKRLFFTKTLKLVPGVKAYLLEKSRDANCTIIHDPNASIPTE